MNLMKEYDPLKASVIESSERLNLLKEKTSTLIRPMHVLNNPSRAEMVTKETQ